MRKIVIFRLMTAVVAVVVPVAVIGAAEIGLRLFRPDINLQGTSADLFEPGVYGDTAGWRPGAVGKSFGVDVAIDERGFRDLGVASGSGKRILLIGDSVSFGVGVEGERTFAGLLAKDYRVDNASVVGYSAVNYRDAAAGLITEPDAYDLLVVGLCLNDVYGTLNAVPRPAGLKQRALAFGRSRFALFQVAKRLVSDRSQFYYMNDRAIYLHDRAKVDEAAAAVSDMVYRAASYGVPSLVVIFPYEYALRMADPFDPKPRRVLAEALRKKNVAAVDLHTKFLSAKGVRGAATADLYLFNDPMHFSETGHRVAYEALRTLIEKR